MNPLSSYNLTRSQLLQVDRLADDLENAFRSDPSFDAERFFQSVSDPTVSEALRSEFQKLQQQQPTLVSASATGGILPPGRACEVRSFEPGMMIDHFELIALVGQGATAVVWKAKNLRLNRFVALKFPSVYSESIAQRLERESQAVARLSHPNIATIYESRNHGRGAYLVSEFITGQSLQTLIESNQLTVDAAIELLISVSEAIAYSHSMKVIHRDLKPQNILIREDGVPIVVDFGLARVLLTEVAVLTHEGDFVGTPGYMAPEQAEGSPDLDERIDVYALGVLMFQMLTGQLPFRGTLQTVIHKILNEPAEPPSKLSTKVDRDLDTICLRCLNKDPDRRFRSAKDLALELRRYQNGESIQSRPISSMEKIVRWSRKKPIEAGLSGLLLVSLLLLVAGATSFAFSMQAMHKQEYQLRLQAEASEQFAKKQREIAVAEAIETRHTVDFLKTVFQDAAPVMWVLKGDGVGSGKPPTLKEIFENAAVGLKERFDGNLQTKANLLETLGDSSRASGYFELARSLLTQARQIRDRERADHPDNAMIELEALANQVMFAKLDQDEGHYELATQAYQKCCDELAGFSGRLEGRNRERWVDLEIETRFHFGRLLLTLQNNEDARTQFLWIVNRSPNAESSNRFLVQASKVGLEYCDARPGEILETAPVTNFFQDNSWAQKIVQGYATQLAFQAMQDWDSAATQYQTLLSLIRERLPETNQWFLLALGDCAGIQLKAGYYEQACENAQRAIEIGEKISPGHPKLLEAKLTLGKELIRAQHYQAGVEYLRSVDQYYAQKGVPEEVKLDLLVELAEGLIQSNQYVEAGAYVERILKKWTGWANEVDSWNRYLEFRAFASSDPERSQAARQEALRLAELIQKPPANGIWCSRVAQVFRGHGKLAQAERFARQAVKFDQARFFDHHPRVANRRMLLGAILMDRGQTKEAILEFEKVLKSRTQFLSADNRLVQEAQSALATARAVQ